MIRSHGRLAAVLAACLMATTVSVGDEPAARRVTDWGEVVDPSRDCKVSYDKARDRLTIAVPGTPHVLSAEIAGLPLDAPRIVQSVDAGFKAAVRVAGKLEPRASKSTIYDPYHGAGLIVWKDEGNYLRLERATAIIHGVTSHYINYELRKDGRLAFSKGIPTGDHSLHLKVERAGGEIRAWRSPDGSRWSELPDLGVELIGPVRVGIVAVNSSRYPLRAELEGFRVDTSVDAGSPSVSSTTRPAWAAGDRREAK